MTDQVHSLTVALTHDMREDEVESLAHAISLFQGVLVVKNNIADPNDFVSFERAKSEIYKKIFDVMSK